jgi:hypothetical protein
MIKYKFGNIECKIAFEDFLSLTINNVKKYKSDFTGLNQLYELIEKNLNQVSHILFDGYEYVLEKGLLHNLYGPAIIRHSSPSAFAIGTSMWFYIDGKLVCDDVFNLDRGCKSLEHFQKKEIFFYEVINHNSKDIIMRKRNFKKEGIDYKKYSINLAKRIEKYQRKKKLQQIDKYDY